MSFLDHLEELRWHIIRSLIAVVVIAIVAFIGKDFVVGTLILGPSRTDFWTYRMMCQLADLIQSPALCVDTLTFEHGSRKISSQFMTHVSVSFAVSLLCMLGVSLGYVVIAPISVRFFSTYQVDPSLQNLFDLSSYINTVTLIVFGTGLLFQLPVIVYFLTKAGIVSSSLMKTYRKHAIIVILILGAIITPPDPFSQILIALPLMLLYQLSIAIAKRIEKREAKKLQTS